MAKNQQPAAKAGADVRYDVKLSARFDHEGFFYSPAHEHVVDQVIFDAMTEAGVVADVKQLS
jgi:hypothetical protein